MSKIPMRFKYVIRIGVMTLAFGQFPCLAQNAGVGAGAQTSAADQQIPPAIAKKFEEMSKRIEQLEAELNARPATPALSAKGSAPFPSATATPVPTAATAPAPGAPPGTVAAEPQRGKSVTSLPATTADKIAPFSDFDWTWLNGNP